MRKLRELGDRIPIQTTVGHVYVALKVGCSAAPNLIWNRESLDKPLLSGTWQGSSFLFCVWVRGGVSLFSPPVAINGTSSLLLLYLKASPPSFVS